jgi:type II secretory pathway component PulC
MFAGQELLPAAALRCGVRRTMRTALLVVLTLGLALAEARGVAVAQAPPAPTSDSERPEAEPDPSSPASEPESDATGIAMEFALVGLIVREGEESQAIIEVRETGRQEFYKVGMPLGDGRVASILDDRVILAFDRGKVELRLAGTPGAGTAGLPPSPGAVRVVPGSEPSPPPPVRPPLSAPGVGFSQVERTHLNELLRAPDLLMHVTPLEREGVRVEEVRSSGLFDILGLKKGDVIRNVNGRVPGVGEPLPRVIEQAGRTEVLRFELDRDGVMDARYLQIRP